MRRSTLILSILIISTTLFATGNRTASLGNFTPMIKGDVQNLYFFPQVLPQHNLLYVKGGGTQPSCSRWENPISTGALPVV